MVILPDSCISIGITSLQVQDYKGNGGESGIRTHVRVSPKHAFQACAFSHSAISPAPCEAIVLILTAARWLAPSPTNRTSGPLRMRRPGSHLKAAKTEPGP